MIPEETIDKIIEASHIEDVVGDHVKIKKTGATFEGICPFHEDSDPSFKVSPAKNIFKCFGCGKGGDSVTFIREYLHKSYPEALRYLADKYNIIIEETEPDPEAEKKQILKDQLIQFNEFALDFYRSQLFLEANALGLEYLQSRFNQESLDLWQIGIAPDSFTGLVTAAREKGFKEEFLLQTGLIKQSEKNHKLYDFFRNRIMFPIFDNHGRVISFSGRHIPGTDVKGGKYINGPDTPVFKKSKTLFGLSHSLRSRQNDRTAILLEGNPDVISLSQIGVNTAVAALGTAFTPFHADIIKRYFDNVIMLYDGDDAGRRAAAKTGKILVSHGLIPYIALLPDGEDPDTFFTTKEQYDSWMEDSKLDFITHYSEELLAKSGQDPLLKNYAVNDVCELLFHLNKTTRDIYLENIGSKSKIKQKIFIDKLREMELERGDHDDDPIRLPKEVDANDFEKWGFYAYQNEYYFRTKMGIEKLTNFTMEPIFHIESMIDSKRIYELANHYGHKVVVDFDMQEMTSVQAFQRNIEGKGNFLFWGSVGHFSKIKQKLYEDTRTCQEIKILGWQKEGFWAWSNGIISDGGFKEIDEYGVVVYDEVNYFIPAFSKIYINDKSIFLDERKFKFKRRDVSLNEWARLFIKVFGDNAKIAITFWIASIFRDHLLHIFKNFPLLNLFGPKGTGKSQMAMSMCCLFGEQQTPFNIHNGTKPGLAEHIQQFSNAFAWIDEYKNSLEYDKIETLKSIYDAIGRSRMNIDKGRKKETTQVNSAVIISGQEMPTADVALFSRMIFLQFHQTEFSSKEKKNYDDLKAMERSGLSHLSTEIIMHRKYFTDHFFENFEEVLKDFFSRNKEHQIEDRILRSMCAIIASFKTLEHKLDLPFDYDSILKPAFKAIRDQNSQISKSNEVGMFWNLLEAMYDDNLLIDKWHFRIDFEDTVITKERELNLGTAKYILKFKFNIVYKLYAQHSRSQGIKPLPSDTLQYYLKNHKLFLGIQNSCRFTLVEHDPMDGTKKKKQNTSAYCFEYDRLDINLTREEEVDNPLIPKEPLVTKTGNQEDIFDNDQAPW